jgi:hypothetical protein
LKYQISQISRSKLTVNKIYFWLISSAAFVILFLKPQFKKKKKKKGWSLTEVQLPEASCHYSNNLSENVTLSVPNSRMEGYKCNYFFFGPLLRVIANQSLFIHRVAFAVFISLNI